MVTFQGRNSSASPQAGESRKRSTAIACALRLTTSSTASSCPQLCVLHGHHSPSNTFDPYQPTDILQAQATLVRAVRRKNPAREQHDCRVGCAGAGEVDCHARHIPFWSFRPVTRRRCTGTATMHLLRVWHGDDSACSLRTPPV